MLRVGSSSSVHSLQGQGFGLVFLSLPLLDVDTLPCLLIAGYAEKWKILVFMSMAKSLCSPGSPQDYSVSSFGNPKSSSFIPFSDSDFPSELIFLLALASMFFGFFFFFRWGVWQHPLGHVGTECVREGGAALSNIPGNLERKNSKRWENSFHVLLTTPHLPYFLGCLMISCKLNMNFRWEQVVF